MAAVILAALGGFGIGLALGAAVAAKAMSAAWIGLIKEAEAKGRVVIRR